jgi:PleD family two-component response regulator
MRIRELALPHLASDVADVVTLSIGGFSGVPRDGLSIKRFLEHADEQLYKAKERGRNRYSVASTHE